MNVIKDVTFEGTILNQIKKTIEFIETQVREHTFLGQHALFVTKRDYPEFVIQEMTVNAFLCKCLHKTAYVKFHIMSSSATNNKKCYCESKRCA